MIRKFHLENFKSFRKATLPLAPLTLLVGPNASGKSNAIEGLRLLSWMAAGNRLDDLLHAIRKNDIDLRGGLADLFGRPDQPIRFGIEVGWAEESRTLELQLGVRQHTGGLSIVTDELESPGSLSHPIIYTLLFGAEDSTSRRYEWYPSESVTEDTEVHPLAFLDQLPAFVGLAHLEAPARELEKQLTQILFLDTNVRRMRGYSERSEQELQSDGSNLSAVLWHLIEDQNREDEVLRFVHAFPEQNIDAIDFIETPRDEVMVQLVETFGNNRQTRDAAVLSDGTLRVLSVAAAVLSVPQGSLVVIEEIDNGVHPSRAEMLLDNLQRVAEERNLSILLTTHNPALQDALPDRSLPHVVACYRDPDTGESKLQRLEDLDRYPQLVARGSLGELSTHGTLEEFLKDRTTPEERREKNRAWLDQLEAKTGT